MKKTMEDEKNKCAFVSNMETLPLDIVSNILSRIPVKYLLCLKCVCKSWLSIISSPEFAHSQFQQSILTNSGRFLVFSGIIDTSMEGGGEQEEEEEEGALEIFYVNLYSYDLDSPESPAVKIPLPLKFGSMDTSIIGSCYGLLCVLLSNSEVILVNPATMTFYKIRKPPKAPKPLRYSDQASYGFGYDHLSEDYKVVWIYYGHRKMRVYSLKSNSWGLIKEGNCLGLESYDIRSSSCGVLISNHLLHWIVVSHSSSHHAIVCYDLCSEQWEQLPFPDGIANINPYSSVAKLGNLDGCLCLTTETYDISNKKVFDVWLMKEYGVKESWVKLDFTYSRLSCRPIAYSKGGQEILMIRYGNPFTQFCWYNTLDKTLRTTGIRGLDIYEFVICWRSLFSLRRGKHFDAETLWK